MESNRRKSEMASNLCETAGFRQGLSLEFSHESWDMWDFTRDLTWNKNKDESEVWDDLISYMSKQFKKIK